MWRCRPKISSVLILGREDTRARIGGHALGHEIDAVVVMEFFSDISPRFASPFGRSSNPPKSVADRLHARSRPVFHARLVPDGVDGFADALDMSLRSVSRDWEKARLFLAATIT